MGSKILTTSISAVLSFFVIRYVLYTLESEMNWYIRVTSQPLTTHLVEKDR